MNDQLQRASGTGLARLMDDVLFDQLDNIVVYVQDESHWVDGDGRVFPMPSLCRGVRQPWPAVFTPIWKRDSFGAWTAAARGPGGPRVKRWRRVEDSRQIVISGLSVGRRPV